MRYKQRGQNSEYPNEIDTWKWGEDVPEWLSDISKIAAVDSVTSKVQLEILPTNTGGFSLRDSSGRDTLITVNSKKDYICREADIKESKLFVLSPLQLKLLYYGYE